MGELRQLNEQNKLAIWAERVTECRNSGQSVLAWCKEHGICSQTYYKWQKRLFSVGKTAIVNVDPPPSPLQRKQGRPEILLTGPYLFPSFAGWQLRGSVFFGGGMDRLSELQRRLPRDIFEYHIKILGIGKPDQSRNSLHRLLGFPQQFLRTADPGLVQVLTDGGLRTLPEDPPQIRAAHPQRVSDPGG